MGRHAADVTVKLTARVPRGQQGFWEIVRALHRQAGEFSAHDVELRSNVHRSTVADFIRRLVKGGYLEEVRQEPRPGHPRPIYRLLRDQPEAPKLRRDGSPAIDQGRGQDQMWRAMKMVERFTAPDLVLLSSTADYRVTRETAKAYIKHLHLAGYLNRLAKGVYRLRPDRNTGPLAPQVMRTPFVFDPNTHEAHALEAAHD